MNPNQAEVYEQVFVTHLFKPWVEHLFGQYSVPNGERMLDLACGTGVVARHFIKQSMRKISIHGVDNHTGMLVEARKHADNVTWVACNAERLPFDKGWFDLVICHQGFQFFQDVHMAARQVRRVLSPDGYALIATWRSVHLHPVHSIMCAGVSHQLDVAASTLSPIFGLSDEENLANIFRSVGFGSITQTSHTLPISFPPAVTQVFLRRTIRSLASSTQQYTHMTSEEKSQFVDDTLAAISDQISEFTEEGSLSFIMHTCLTEIS